MQSKVRIAGHPLHPMMIAYPIAAYTGTFIGYVAHAVTGDQFWLRFAIVLNVAGIVTAAAAMLPGFIDWAIGIPKNTPAKRTGLIHMVLNDLAFVSFAIPMFMYIGRWDEQSANVGAGIALSGLGLVATTAAGWFGWSLVQDHHVGVNLTREQEKLEEVPALYRRAS